MLAGQLGDRVVIRMRGNLAGERGHVIAGAGQIEFCLGRAAALRRHLLTRSTPSVKLYPIRTAASPVPSSICIDTKHPRVFHTCRRSAYFLVSEKRAPVT